MSSQVGSPILYPLSLFSTGENWKYFYVLFMLLSLCHHVFFRGSQSFVSLEIQWDISLNIKSNFVLLEGGLCVMFQLLLASSSSSREGAGDSVSTLESKLFHISE